MEKNQSEILVIQVNGNPILEYDRGKELSDAQQQSLKLMEEKLDLGLELGDQHIEHPNLEQKVQFVSANLVSALLNDEETIAAAAGAYLAHTLPDLKQLKAVEQNGEIGIELIFDREFQAEEKLNFMPIDNFTSRSH